MTGIKGIKKTVRDASPWKTEYTFSNEDLSLSRWTKVSKRTFSEEVLHDLKLDNKSEKYIETLENQIFTAEYLDNIDDNEVLELREEFYENGTVKAFINDKMMYTGKMPNNNMKELLTGIRKAVLGE